MSGLSLRTQITAAMIAMVVLTSVTLAWFAYRSANKIIIQEAIRAVSIVASSREELLVRLLKNRKDRWASLLELINQKCGEEIDKNHRSCAESLITNYMKVSVAVSARFITPKYTADFGRLRQQDYDLPMKNELARFQNDGNLITYVNLNESENHWILIAEFSSEDINKIFQKNIGLGESGETFLAGPNGHFLTPSRYPSKAGHSHPIKASPMLRCLKRENDEILDYDYRGVKVVHGFRFVEEAGGACIMAHITEAEAFAPSAKLLKIILLFILFFVALAAVVAWFIARWFTRPIECLAASARELQEGNFETTISSEGPDEVRTFAEAFKSMAASLVNDIKRRDEPEKVLKEAVRSRDEFLSVASHELKTPLTSIKLQTQVTKKYILRKTEIPLEKLEKYLVLMDKQVDRLNRLVDDMLDISRIGSKKLTITKETFDMKDLARDVVDRLQPLFSQKDVPINLEAESVSGVWDHFRIEQVLTNLLMNALKYGGNTPVTVFVKRTGESVVLTVKDEGKGIPLEHQERIFYRFERAVSPDEISGLGLGLFIVQQIVLMHGGKISVKSNPNEGTSFIVDLPLEVRP